MLATGNIKAQIITAIKNFSVKKKKEIEELRRNSNCLFYGEKQVVSEKQVQAFDESYM